MRRSTVSAQPIPAFRRVGRCFLLSAMLLIAVLSLAACDGNRTTDKPSEPAVTPTDTPTPTPDAPVIDESARQVSLDFDGTHQTIDGFGAGFTWYSELIFQNKYYNEVFDLLFKDAGLSILRFKNEYDYGSFNSVVSTNKLYYAAAKKRAEERGEDVTVLYSSWSPPASLKSNNKIAGYGTLKRNENGEYVYDEFGKWWTDAVAAYRKEGLPVDYVSIQNECDFQASYDGCEFGDTETSELAAYSEAFLATYRSFRETFGEDAPQMLAPETMTVGPSTLRAYIKPILAEEPDSIQVLAHHLYLGGDSTDDPNYCDADSFLMNFRSVNTLANDYGLRKWQTEFYRGTALQTANVINNSLIYENVNAYIFWGGVWAGQVTDGIDSGNLIISGNYFRDGKSEHGYMATGDYYAMRHFSQFIRPGYQRIDIRLTNADGVRSSAYVSPDGSRVVIVLLNNNADAAKTQVALENYEITSSQSYQSVFTEGYTADMMYKDLGALNNNRLLTLPGESVTTIVLDGKKK